MGESVKALVALLVIIALVVSALLWFGDWHPSPRVWFFRFASPTVALAALALLCWASFRMDKVPDYLRRISTSYFDRDGFCFVPVPAVCDGVCILQLFFQNRFERPCQARVVLQPSSGFFLTRKKIEKLTLDIECGPGAFGIARIPFPVPERYQGQTVKFDVGAAVRYQGGRGRRLRFREGLRVGSVEFDSWSRGVLTLAAACAGTVLISHPASTTLWLPAEVRSDLPDDTVVEVETLWQLGDPKVAPDALDGSIPSHAEPSEQP